MNTRISPEVFDSVSRIASTIRSCSSLLRNSFVRMELPARASASATEASAATAESTKSTAARGPTASASYGEKYGTASARRVGVSAETPHYSGNDRHDDEKDNKEQKAGCRNIPAPSFRYCFAAAFIFAANRFED